MANQNRGEVSFEYGGASHKLKLSTNAICNLEDESGKGINEFAEALNDPGNFKMTDMRMIFWAMLNGDSYKMSIIDAGNMIDELGMEKVTDLIAKTFKLAFPEAATDGVGKPNKAA